MTAADRRLSAALAALPAEALARLQPAEHPRRVEPMLATLTDRRFSDAGWLYERKLDGERCIAFRHGDEVTLLSRRQQRLTGTYPEIVDALALQGGDDFVLDGEVVAFEGNRTSFAALQQRLGITDPAAARRSPVAVFYYLFDVLHLDGYDLRALALRHRKALLRRTVRFKGPLRFTNHRVGQGEVAFADACARGWEGIVAKRADSRYSSTRSRDWLKFKCEQAQEFVVGGFTDPEGSRHGFGALLVGHYRDGALRYAGKVGTGFDERTLRDLRKRLGDLEVSASPFADPVADRRPHWARPVLVVQVAFSEWTRDGKLRHPRYQGLRPDKAPAEVVREEPGA